MAVEKGTLTKVETFIEYWNETFLECPLTVADLKKSHAVMGALFMLLDRLGIDKDAVLAPPPEELRNKSIQYYWDLLPVINMVRVINHLVSVMPQVSSSITIANILQPSATVSHSILLLVSNLMIFNEQRLADIEPYEQQLFAKTEQVKTLEDRKHKLKELLNEQAQEKGKRAERLEKVDIETQQFEKELTQEKDFHDDEKQELDALVKENHQASIVLEQKKTQIDALTAEIARKKALRVYDADDIKAQAEGASQNVQEAEEKLNSLRATLMQKENSLKNLQAIKPSLDAANGLLHEIMKLSESLKDFDSGDLESDSKEGEIDVLNMELSELQVQLVELQTAAAEVADKRQENCAKRQQEKSATQSLLREAEEKDTKCSELSKKAVQRIEEIKTQTLQYEKEKSMGIEQLDKIKNDFEYELKTIGEELLRKATEMSSIIDRKLEKLII